MVRVWGIGVLDTAECDLYTRLTFDRYITESFRFVLSMVLSMVYMRQLPISLYSSGTRRGCPGAHAHAPRTRRLCLCRPRPSPPSSLRLLQLCFSSLSDAAGWRARVRALAMLRLELLPVRHGGKEGLTRLHRRRSSLQGLRRCRRGLRGEDGVGSF